MANISQARPAGLPDTMRVATGLYRRRRLRNQIVIGLAFAATAIGLGWLAIILGTLVFKGASGLSLSVFTEMTRPTGSNGGLYNALVGSLILTVLGVAIGTPLGILAGTYMAEYGRFSRLTHVVRFINDILLSAPSIVVGLFVYDVMVVPMGHFSGISGAVALALLVAPVVVRTTEDMLSLVPRELREAASALGMPRAYVIAKVSYRAAIAGIVTGILLAVARVSGETAPLLFTAFNNQFFGEFPYINSPMASLPAVIFQYAMSPYADWQQLAWTGALIITVAVLALSITARALASSRKVA
jgi:phosphate transport system permease protein